MKLKDIFEIQKHFDRKKTPCDIVEALEEVRYSESKGKDIKVGDMHLAHYIRRQLKDERADDETIKKLNKQIREFKNFINKIRGLLNEIQI